MLYEIENLLFTNLAKTYFSQDLQHKVLSKHKTFAAHSLGNTGLQGRRRAGAWPGRCPPALSKG